MTEWKFALRSLRRHTRQTVLNVVGLAVAMAAALLIVLVVRFEHSFDRTVPHYNRIWRVVQRDIRPESNGGLQSGSYYGMVKLIREQVPQVEVVAGSMFEGNATLAAGDTLLDEPGHVYLDPQFLEIFPMQFLQGDPKTALKDINSIVIADSIARKLFPKGDAMGKRIRVNDTYDLEVTGIVADPPQNTDFPFRIYCNYDRYIKDNDWAQSNGSLRSSQYTYLRLPADADTSQLTATLNQIFKTWQGENLVNERLSLMPLVDQHFDTEAGNYNRGVPKTFLNGLMIVGLLLVLTACINLVNLATAENLRRSHEVGVRKVLGSTRWQVVRQYLIEVFCTSILAAVLALVLASLSIGWVNGVVGRSLSLEPVWLVAGVLLGQALLVTLVAGLYPAYVLSRFAPALTLRRGLTVGRGMGLWLRRGLVFLQFAISLGLLFGVLVIQGQLDYMRNKPMGFRKDAIVQVPLPVGQFNRDKLETFRAELHQSPNVQLVTYGFGAPTARSNNWNGVGKITDTRDRLPWSTNTKAMDGNYMKLYEIKLVAGRYLTDNDSLRVPKTDGEQLEGNVIINQPLMQQLGFRTPQEAINKQFRWNNRIGTIVGVTDEVFSNTFQVGQENVVFYVARHRYYECGILISSAQTPATIEHIQQAYRKIWPTSVYRGYFLDEDIEQRYQEEARQSRLMQAASLVAVFVGCLGLLGLVSFMTVQKTKEVGIRKVLGANMGQLLWVFYREFAALLGVSLVVALPLAVWMLRGWLADFAYRIELDYQPFLLGTLILAFVAGATIAVQTVRAALINPVKALRTE